MFLAAGTKLEMTYAPLAKGFSYWTPDFVGLKKTLKAFNSERHVLEVQLEKNGGENNLHTVGENSFMSSAAQ